MDGARNKKISVDISGLFANGPYRLKCIQKHYLKKEKY